MNSNLPQKHYVCFVPVDQIVIDDKFIVPTAWDAWAVEDDLRHFISESRSLACTPEVSLDHNRLVVINGAPFVRAAKTAVPPLETIVCAFSDPHMLQDPRVVVADVADLLKRDEQRGQVHHVLYFHDSLLPNEVHDACTAIEGCLVAWPGSEPKTAVHETLMGRSIIKWAVPASIPEDRRVRRMASEIRRIVRKLSVTSWNGIRVEQ